MSRLSPTLLAIDTSTEVLALAVQGPAGSQAWTGPGGAQSSATLLPQAQAMLTALGLRWADLDAIAFGNGPGAFTGLRTACAVAQGLALGIGCAVIPVDSLSIVAEDSGAHKDAALWVVMDARMDELYAAEFRHDGARWQAQQAAALWTLPALLSAWTLQPPAQLAGSALAAFGERLSAPGAMRFPTETDRAGALMRLALQLWQSGAAVDAALAVPTYVRDKVASTTAERMAGRRAAP